MTRRKSRPDLDTFHAHLDALKLSFIREHYPDVCAAPPKSNPTTSPCSNDSSRARPTCDATDPSNGVSDSPDSP